jgi:hypothetical protein
MNTSRFRAVLCLLGATAILLTGCGGNGYGSSIGGVGAISVTITSPASSPTITQGQSVDITASVANDSSDSGVSWSLSGQGNLSDQTTTTVTYNAPALVTASFTATITATSVSYSPATATLTINVTAGSNDGEANGQYAFLVNGFDDATGEQFAYVGSLTFNGRGEITSGVEDANLPSGVLENVAVGGTYSIGTDNRGIATVTGGGLSTTFAFSVGSISNGVASQISIIEFDDSTGTSGRRGSGTAFLQNSTAFNVSSINGPYALQLIGQNANLGSRAVVIGAFTATGATGNLSGTADFNDDGNVMTGNTFNGTITSSAATASSGRVTLSILGTSQVAYIVSANQLLGMSTTDVSTQGLASGQILQQSTASFISNSLNGAAIQYDTGIGSVAGAGYAEAGSVTFNSTTGQAAFSLDTNDSGTSGTLSGAFSYSVSANGHVIVTGTTSDLPDFWLVSANEAFVMGTGAFANAGLLQPQATGPFSVASISGNYAVGMAEAQAVTAGNVASGVANSSGSGTLNATLDISTASGQLQSAQAQSLTLSIAAGDAATGRFTDNSNGIGYIITPSQFVRIDSTAAAPRILIFAP